MFQSCGDAVLSPTWPVIAHKGRIPNIAVFRVTRFKRMCIPTGS